MSPLSSLWPSFEAGQFRTLGNQLGKLDPATLTYPDLRDFFFFAAFPPLVYPQSDLTASASTFRKAAALADLHADPIHQLALQTHLLQTTYETDQGDNQALAALAAAALGLDNSLFGGFRKEQIGQNPDLDTIRCLLYQLIGMVSQLQDTPDLDTQPRADALLTTFTAEREFYGLHIGPAHYRANGIAFLVATQLPALGLALAEHIDLSLLNQYRRGVVLLSLTRAAAQEKDPDQERQYAEQLLVTLPEFFPTGLKPADLR